MENSLKHFLFKKNLKLIVLSLISCVLISCGTSKTINLRNHSFDRKVSKIVWFQIAGLSEEHLAMLRFADKNANYRTVFESLTCIGKAWNHNLFNLRPSSQNGFLSQITGKNKIKNSCEDYKLKPIWSYLREDGYRTGIFETGASEFQKIKNKCIDQDATFMDDTILWLMKGKTEEEDSEFHYQDKVSFNKPGIYYDKSCQKGTCFSNVFDNIKSIYSRFIEKRKKRYQLFLVRDFTYEEQIKKNKILKAREILVELEKTISYFYELAKVDDEMLLLITSSAAQSFEYPKKGSKWYHFEKSGKFIKYHGSNLVSPVFAYGARSENFCGMYEEYELFLRALWSPRDKKLVDYFKDMF